MEIRKLRHWFNLMFLALCAGAAPAYADPGDVVAQDIRSPDRPLPMMVHLSQDELLVGRDPGNSYQVGGGLVGALVDSAIQSTVSGGAEKAISPSLDAFSRAEAEQILVAAIRESVAPVDWIRLAEGGALRDASPAARNAVLERSGSSQILDADCSYNISQRFQAVYAYCSLQIASKGVAADQRWEARNLVYNSYVEAQVELGNIAKSIGGRREQWTANSGSLLREGLRHALQKAGALVGRQLQMTAEDVAAVENNEKIRLVTAYVGMAGEHKGRIVEGGHNILEKFHPNSGGLSYRYKPGSDGVIFLENLGGLFYHWTITAPEG